MKLKSFLMSGILLSAVSMGGLVSFTHNFDDSVKTSTNAAEGTYYDGISESLTGSSLRSALNNLNSSKRQRTVGYSSMFTYYPYTDPDPSDSNKILGFYSGIGYSEGQMNREHIWPNSRGGGAVDADIHMVRPTANSDNSARGNSFYAEGYNVTGNGQNDNEGWDPYTYNSSWPVQYRGQAARIIFYCMIASTSLNLADNLDTSSSTPGYSSTMGKLSDLLKWNLENPVSSTEVTRNEAIATTIVSGSVIQGNRNPFIDHPEYACKIWGSTNSTTESICATAQGDSITLKANGSDAGSSQSMAINSTLTFTAYLNGTQTSDVTWSSSNTSVATISTSGVVSSKSINGSTTITCTSTADASVFATCTITVTAPVAVTGVDVSPSTASINVGGTTTLTATISPSDATNKAVSWSSSNSSIASVNSSGVVSGVAVGDATITATTSDGGYTDTSAISVSRVSGGTMSITISSYSLTSSYAWHTWSSNDITGQAYIWWYDI